MIKITEELKNGIVIVKIQGEIEKEDEQEIVSFFDKKTNDGNRKFIIDASKIEYLGSSTLGVFSKIYQKTCNSGGKIIFADLSMFVKKIFKITTFDKFFNIKYSVEDAIAELKNF